MDKKILIGPRIADAWLIYSAVSPKMQIFGIASLLKPSHSFEDFILKHQSPLAPLPKSIRSQPARRGSPTFK